MIAAAAALATALSPELSVEDFAEGEWIVENC
jgi:hypothetical protein